MKSTDLKIKDYIGNNHLNKRYIKKFQSNYKKIFIDVLKEKNNKEENLYIFNDKFKLNFDKKRINRFNKFKTIVVIGMGGSILGAEAIKNFLSQRIKKEIFFFNNLDPKRIHSFKKFKKIKNILFIIISKSGNTIETLSNLSYLNIIKKNQKT